MEVSQDLFIEPGFVSKFACQSGIHDYSAAQHDGIDLRKHRGKGLILLDGEKVAVVADRISARLCRFPKHIPIRRILVEIFLDTGMDDQLFQRIFVEDLEERVELVRVVFSDSRFDRDLYRRLRENFIEEPVESFSLGEKARTPVLGNDRSGRTAQIQIDLTVAELVQFVCRMEEVRGLIGQDLRNQDDPSVVVGQDVIQFTRCETIALVRGNEWREVFIDLREKGMMGIPIDVPGQSLHGRKINIHVNNFSHSLVSRTAADSRTSCKVLRPLLFAKNRHKWLSLSGCQ